MRVGTHASGASCRPHGLLTPRIPQSSPARMKQAEQTSTKKYVSHEGRTIRQSPVAVLLCFSRVRVRSLPTSAGNQHARSSRSQVPPSPTSVVEILVVLVDEMCRILRILNELLDHVAVEELAVGLRDTPIQLRHQFTWLRAVEEMNLAIPGWNERAHRRYRRRGDASHRRRLAGVHLHSPRASQGAFATPAPLSISIRSINRFLLVIALLAHFTSC